MVKLFRPDRRVKEYLPCPQCGAEVECRLLFFREYVGESPHGMVQDFEEVTDMLHACDCQWSDNEMKALSEKALERGRRS